MSEATFAVPDDFTVDPELLTAIRANLEAAGVEFCFSTYVDIHDVPKAKTTPLSAFEKMAHGSGHSAWGQAIIHHQNPQSRALHFKILINDCLTPSPEQSSSF